MILDRAAAVRQRGKYVGYANKHFAAFRVDAHSCVLFDGGSGRTCDRSVVPCIFTDYFKLVRLHNIDDLALWTVVVFVVVR